MINDHMMTLIISNFEMTFKMSNNYGADTKVTVEGCQAKVSRDEASAILAETAQLTEGPERDRFPSKDLNLNLIFKV